VDNRSGGLGKKKTDDKGSGKRVGSPGPPVFVVALWD
jgi:hypothetical protein